MDFILPLTAAFLQGSSSLLDKVVLSVRRMDYRAYVGASFPIIFLVYAGIVLLQHQSIDIGLFAGPLLTVLLASIAINICSNALYYRALQHDHLTELQTIDVISRLPIIFLVSYLFADERNWAIIAAALVSAIALIWAHYDHHHFHIQRRTLVYLIWVIFGVPWAAVFSKILLYAWSPAPLEMIRNGGMALVFGFLYFRQEERISKRAFWLLVLLNTLSALAWLFYFTSYQQVGVVYTMLFYSLQPLLVYFGAVLFLKERFERRKFVAFCVVLGSIVAVQLLT
ncbi:MAG TPA: DMT family transporter [Candidatus Paceibacterota bacterium]|nr:DMT family transporter [Candidatus Paceibacterota bacterium]